MRWIAWVLVFATSWACADSGTGAIRKEVGNRVIEIDTKYSREISQSKVTDCYGASPVAIMVTVEGVIKSLIPDDVERSLKFRTSFNDVLGGSSGVIVGTYEVIGHLKPINYEVRFSATGNPEGETFDILSVTSSLFGDSKSQAERKKGICDTWKMMSSRLQ